MPRIVSGIQPQDAGISFQESYRSGQEANRAAQAQQLDALRLLLSVQADEMQRRQRAQEQRAALTQQRTDTSALAASEAMKARAATNQLAPVLQNKQTRAEHYARSLNQMAQRGVSPDTLAKVGASIEEIEKSLEAREMQGLAEQDRERAVADGLMDPAEAQALQAEDPAKSLALTRERRSKKADELVVSRRAQNELANAQTMLQAIPEGPMREILERRIAEFEVSPSLFTDEAAVKQFGADIRDLLQEGIKKERTDYAGQREERLQQAEQFRQQAQMAEMLSKSEDISDPEIRKQYEEQLAKIRGETPKMQAKYAPLPREPEKLQAIQEDLVSRVGKSGNPVTLFREWTSSMNLNPEDKETQRLFESVLDAQFTPRGKRKPTARK